MKKWLTTIITLVMMLTGTAMAENAAHNDSADWNIEFYENQEENTGKKFYLTTGVEGIAVQDGRIVSKMQMKVFVGHNSFSFALYNDGSGTPVYNDGETIVLPIYVRLREMGFQQESKAAVLQNSPAWILPGGGETSEETFNGITDLIIMEMRQRGTVDLSIPISVDESGAATWLSFSIPAESGIFSRLYSGADSEGWTYTTETAWQ